MLEPLVNYRSAPFGSPFSAQAMLADSVTAANLPYEGLWVPASFLETMTVELSGSISTLSLDIWGTNQLNPVNTYTVTLGGSETDGDTLTLTFSNPLLPGGSEAVAVTTSGGESLGSIATALAAGINTDANLAPLGFRAAAASDVVTITWPSLPGVAPSTFNSSPPYASPTILTATKSSGASETLTIGNGADGTNLTSSHLTALGLSAITPMPVGWVKARITTLTGTNAIISAAMQGCT